MKSQMQAVVVIVALLFAFAGISQAAVPLVINFQGRITDELGDPITGPVDLTFKIYTSESAPTEAWSEFHNDVQIPIEIVQLQLGSITPFPVDLFNNSDLWLGISVDADPELTPRQRLVTVPFAMRSEGVMGHVRTDVAELHIEGSVGNQPRLLIKDDVSVTPGVDEYLRLSDLSVAIVVDRGAGDVDWSVLKADELSIWHLDGTIGSKMDRHSMQLRSADAPLIFPIPLPPLGEPFFALSDDVLNQMFASLYTAGELKVTCVDCGTASRLTPEFLEFTSNSGATLDMRVGRTGMELHGGSVQLLDGADLTVTGTLDVTGGTLDLSGASLAVGGDLTVDGDLVLATGTYSAGTGTLTFDGPSPGWTSLSEAGLASDLGSVELTDAGGTVTLSTRILAGDLTIDADGLDVLTLSGGGSSGGGIYLSDASSRTLTLDATSLTFSDGVTDAGIRRVGNNLEVFVPPLSGAGLDLGGIVTFENPSLLSVTSGTEVRFADGSFSDYLGVSGDVRIDGGGIRVRGGSLLVEPDGGGPGGRLTIDLDHVTLTDDASSHTVTFHRSAGATMVSVSGTLAIYRHDGVQLTGPGLDRIDIASSGLSLTRPSNNDAFVCTLDDPADVFYCDLDDDGLRDVRTQHTPVKELVLDDGTGLRCDGPASFTDCDVSGPSTLRSTWSCDVDDDATVDLYCDDLAPGPRLVVASGTELRCDGPASFADCDVSGPSTLRSTWSCDVDDDATVDLYCDDLAPGPRLVVASGSLLRCEGPAVFVSSMDVDGSVSCRSSLSIDVDNDASVDFAFVAAPFAEFHVNSGRRFICDGLSTFGQPVQVNSDLTVNGQLQVFGPKMFVQQHPEDETKEIYYVALEGNEAGTYTRGSAQLSNGVVRIELPEDFHLVTNTEGLTAQITPRGPVNSMLYVESVTPTMLVVKSSNPKDASVKFDFMVNGVRNGFENHQVIRDKKSLAINE